MADLGDILGDGPESRQPGRSLSEVFAAQAAQQADQERREVSARMAGLLGPIAWAVFRHGQGRISMGRASEIALEAMRKVGSETITVVGYVQLTKSACDIADEILGKDG
jgi:hypothetical protein